MGQEIKSLLDTTLMEMEKTIEHLRKELSPIRGGKLSTSLVENIVIPHYGAKVLIPEVANVSLADSRTIVIKPYETNNLAPIIEKALIEANLGINTERNGNIVTLTIPKITEDRRNQLIKQIKQLEEQAKDTISNICEDIKNKLKNQHQT